MKVSKLIAKLQELEAKHGDIDVLLGNDDGSVWACTLATVHVAEEDEYPTDWEMPAGYTFILLEN